MSSSVAVESEQVEDIDLVELMKIVKHTQNSLFKQVQDLMKEKKTWKNYTNQKLSN